MAYNGVIEKATGYLIKAGYTDFTTDPNFDPVLEEQKENPPIPSKVLSGAGSQVHKWDGTEWILVNKPTPTDDIIQEIQGTTVLDLTGKTIEKLHLRLIGNATIQLQNHCFTYELSLLIEQDNIGAHVTTFDNSCFKLPAAGVALTTSADAKDFLTFARFGEDFYLKTKQYDF